VITLSEALFFFVRLGLGVPFPSLFNVLSAWILSICAGQNIKKPHSASLQYLNEHLGGIQY
jgi:hypothetical protein